MSDPTKTVVQKCNHWMRLSVAIQICLKESLLDILHDPLIGGLTKNKQQLHADLTQFKKAEEKNLKGVIKPFHWDKLCHNCCSNCQASCPRQGQSDTKDLDTTCIIVLIIHRTQLPPPSGKKEWKQVLPQIGDQSKAAYILLARQLRNDLIHCSLNEFSTQQQFEDFWIRIENILKGLGYASMIVFNNLKTSSLDPYLEQQIDSLQDKYEDLMQTKCDQADMEKFKMDTGILQHLVTVLEVKVESSVTKEDLQQHLTYLLKVKNDFETRLGNLENKVDNLEECQRINNSKIERTAERVDDLKDNVEANSNKMEANNNKIEANSNKIETIEQKFKILEEKPSETKDNAKQQSTKLKLETKAKYEKVQVAVDPRSSSYCNNKMDRDDIIVNLSLLDDTKTPFAMEVFSSSINEIHQIIKKEKQLTSTQVSYKDIVKSPNDYVVISGRPGCGKTTLVETLLYQWSTDKLWKDDYGVKFDFVFVIYLRKLVRFRKSVDITTEQILSHFYPDYDFSMDKTLLILEGFDELPENEKLRQKEEQFTDYNRAVYDLLDPNNTKLPFTRIVTSRPSACSIPFDTVLSGSESYKQTPRMMEVTGFSDNNIFRYVLKHFPDLNQALLVITKLREMPIVYDMMMIPFYCWGVCYLIKNDIPVEEFGQTYTALFTNLLALFIRNHGMRNQSLKLRDVVQDETFKTVCLGLAELAFQLEEEKKINFTSDDISGQIPMKDLIRDSGMIIEIENDENGCLPSTYQFLHYTFHEFLVAIHLFATGQTHIESRNTQILSMLAGLLGGVSTDSKSSYMVKELSKLLLTKKNARNICDVILESNGRHQLNDFILLSPNELFAIIYEFQNPVITKLDFELSNKSYKDHSSYGNQCTKYFENQCLKKEISFGTVNLCLDNDKLRGNLFSVCSVNEISFDMNPTIVQYIAKGNLQFLKISVFFLVTTDKTVYKMVAETLPRHCQILEVIINQDSMHFLKVLYQYQKRNKTKMKKLIVNFYGKIEIPTLKAMIPYMDVCEEAMFAYNINAIPGGGVFQNHCHNKECVSPSDWRIMRRLQREIDKLLDKDYMKILRNVTVVAHCNQFGFIPTAYFPCK